MTIGRTASNAIKIKTDGGTTRAVECSCCVSAGCGCSIMSGNIQSIIATANQISVNGRGAAWNGTSAIYQTGFGQLSWHVSYSGGILCVVGDTGNNTVVFASPPQICLQAGIGVPITISGIIDGQNYSETYPADHAFSEDQISLSILFT